MTDTALAGRRGAQPSQFGIPALPSQAEPPRSPSAVGDPGSDDAEGCRDAVDVVATDADEDDDGHQQVDDSVEVGIGRDLSMRDGSAEAQDDAGARGRGEGIRQAFS